MTHFEDSGGIHLEFPISAYFEVQQLSAEVRRKWQDASVICSSQPGLDVCIAVPRQASQESKLVLSPI